MKTVPEPCTPAESRKVEAGFIPHRNRGVDWPLELLDCEIKRETWGNRSLIEAWFGLFEYRTRRF